MWIRTQGGYLLNMDKVDFVVYDEDCNETRAFIGDRVTSCHVIGDGDLCDYLAGGIRCNVTVLEVHGYGRN